MKVTIEETLHVLIGLPLAAAGRAHALEWFHFGEQREKQQSPDGDSGVAGEYALHTQCSWRIIGPNGVEVASADRYFAAGDDPFKEYPDFDWDQPGANRCDERMRALIEQHAATPLAVRAVQADDIGSLRLVLDKGYTLDIFPDSSLNGEHWRFFTPHHREQHFIVTGTKIQRFLGFANRP